VSLQELGVEEGLAEDPAGESEVLEMEMIYA